MAKIVSPNWKTAMVSLIENRQTIDEIIGFNKAAQWLVIQLTNQHIPFKVHNLGAGVKRITTVTDTCPCCHNKL